MATCCCPAPQFHQLLKTWAELKDHEKVIIIIQEFTWRHSRELNGALQYEQVKTKDILRMNVFTSLVTFCRMTQLRQNQNSQRNSPDGIKNVRLTLSKFGTWVTESLNLTAKYSRVKTRQASIAGSTGYSLPSNTRHVGAKLSLSFRFLGNNQRALQVCLANVFVLIRPRTAVYISVSLLIFHFD